MDNVSIVGCGVVVVGMNTVGIGILKAALVTVAAKKIRKPSLIR
jgi:hypothetical protein